MDRRRLALAGVTLGLIALALMPAVVAFTAGWLHLPRIEPPGHPAAPDRTPPEAWAAFSLFYLVWIVGVAVLLVWSYDRLGYHWQPHERKPRLTRKERRKRAAVMGALTLEDEARVDAALQRRRARVRREQAAEAARKAGGAGAKGDGAGRKRDGTGGDGRGAAGGQAAGGSTGRAAGKGGG
jgi:hypothetical protein